MEKVMLDNNAQDKLDGEGPTLFHILKMIKRRETRVIRHVQDQQRKAVTRHQDILNTFVTHLKQKYEPIAIDNTCVAKLQSVIHLPCPPQYDDQLEKLITSEELFSALGTSVRKKSTCHRHYPGVIMYNWDTIHPDLLELVNQMFLHKNITTSKNMGS
jgi:hypothetical protein